MKFAQHSDLRPFSAPDLIVSMIVIMYLLWSGPVGTMAQSTQSTQSTQSAGITSPVGNASLPATTSTPAKSTDFTPEEAAQLKEVLSQRTAREADQKTASDAILNSKTDDEAAKATLRLQLTQARLSVLALYEELVVARAKIRTGCLDCEYKGGTLTKPTPTPTPTPTPKS